MFNFSKKNRVVPEFSLKLNVNQSTFVFYYVNINFKY